MFPAEVLVEAVRTNSHDYHRFQNGFKAIRMAVDVAAALLAAQSSEWPADVQFPRDVRDEAIRKLTDHFLKEKS